MPRKAEGKSPTARGLLTVVYTTRDSESRGGLGAWIAIGLNDGGPRRGQRTAWNSGNPGAIHTVEQWEARTDCTKEGTD